MKRVVTTLCAAGVLACVASGCFVVVTEDGLAVGGILRPAYRYIPGTQIRVVTNAAGDVLDYGGAYYRWHAGRWWRSNAWNGGWVRTAVVPGAFLKIPASHRMHHLVRRHPRWTGKVIRRAIGVPKPRRTIRQPRVVQPPRPAVSPKPPKARRPVVSPKPPPPKPDETEESQKPVKPKKKLRK